ncbi:MAG TPA: isoleucine--tRNA ligase [Bacteroidia bacterium]|nr:isoleucine--tRNA ligase [Bacteroidia bacterium]
MSKKYNEYKQLNLSQIGKDVLKLWAENKTFEKSISEREGKTPFVFYEGPPSANGMPGIHHVMARSIKDIFCRFKTMQGFQVKRKAGWDTHGLPIELGVEKALGITKEDIGKKITVEQYNLECRKDVMKYTDKWEAITSQMGYWVDMKDPYITYDNRYIESVWWLLNNLYEKNLLYKGFTIQPYSPAAGTGLSSHELNQPGCYRDVKDRTATVMFKATNNTEFKIESLKAIKETICFLAWTTTPWTLPSNTALAVGKDIDYVLVKSFNPFSHESIHVILAKDLVGKYFSEKSAELKLEDYQAGDKAIPFKIITEFKGSDLASVKYEQLLPFSKPTDGEDAFRVIIGDFVTTTDGTGIVHIAPSFGADDFRVAKQNNIGSLTLVDKRGKFLPEVNDGVFLYGEEFVKEAYLNDDEKKVEFERQKKILEANHKIKDLKVYLSVDERIVLKLQEEGKLFKKETYEHSYPHCWRTDKPVLYYPLDSWFIKTTALKERMIELNKTINWKPESTGTGRFGSWLENLNDWNLSRSRFWGIPIPIWTSEDRTEQTVINSAEELKKQIDNAVAKGYMDKNPLSAFKPGDNSTENYATFDLHKPYADTIVLEKNGKKLFREPDLIDVWFDSGAMPYAQLHYPFENKDLIDNKKYYPADFIAEGVDQTRGWFFTLHAIATMCFDSVAYKNVVSNGLVLDKNGNKMSKRLGNAVDPFETIEKFGADATRWYMITNAAPWDNLKFDTEGIGEVQRKFFGTLHNTYSFFVLYANVDGFNYSEAEIPAGKRPEIDQWILSELNSLIKNVEEAFSNYEPHRAGRFIEYFVDEHLSNWYVRLCRRRFWKGDYSEDKIAAYQTLYRCLEVIAQLAAPIAPFFTDRLFNDLNSITNRQKTESIHLSDFPKVDEKLIDKELEERMELAQKISSMILSIRKKENLKVRQPLNKIQIPVLDEHFQKQVDAVKDLILAEVNVKEIEFVNESHTQIVKNLKLNFKTLGKKCGKHMKAVQSFAADNTQAIISGIEKNGKFDIKIEGDTITLELEDVEVIPVDIPGWKVANSGPVTVALDITLTEPLKQEGIAREIVNRIQNIRKDKGFEVTDRINIKVLQNDALNDAIKNNLNYICSETLTSNLQLVEQLEQQTSMLIEVDEKLNTYISVEKLN